MSAVRVERVGDVTVVVAEGLFTGGAETEALREQLERALEELGQRKILLNLSATQLMLSLAVGILIQTHARAVERGILFWVCGVRPTLRKVFETLRVQSSALKYDDDCRAALEALQNL